MCRTPPLQMKTLYTCGSIVLLSALVTGYCPVQDSIAPCTCFVIEEGISVQCVGPKDAANIQSVIKNLENSENLELVLQSLSLQAEASLLSEVSSLHLQGVRLETIKPNSTFVWSKLAEVNVEASTIENRPLPYFSEAHLLKHLEIRKIDVPVIGSDFRENIPATLTYLDIRKTKTSVVESQALGHLRNLEYFLLVDLPLRELPRNVLPVIMPSLHTFILGNTKIEKLESNFFNGMPKLEVLMMNGNQLTSLDFSSFAPVENQLTHLLAERNPLVCSCNLLWLAENTQKKGSMKVLATCKDHATLKRKEVTSLAEDEYCS